MAMNLLLVELELVDALLHRDSGDSLLAHPFELSVDQFSSLGRYYPVRCPAVEGELTLCYSLSVTECQ
jgi:hypothetical protein